MTKDDIKQQYTMADILARYGLRTDRKGFCRCPFHQGDREASMKIYKNDFHCFGCGANGDIFTFIQLMDGVDFKTAFMSLGGTYEYTQEGHRKAQIAAYRVKKQRETEFIKAEKERLKKAENNDLITMYRLYLSVCEPMSSLWCEIYNKLQYQLYIHDILDGWEVSD